MRSVLLSKHGNEDNLHIACDQPIPQCASNEILIRVLACAVDEIDVLARQGDFDHASAQSLGFAVSGEVSEVGARVTDVAVNDPVIAMLPLDSIIGGYAEYVTVLAVNAFRKPRHLSYEEAVALLIPGIRAYTAFHYGLRLRPSESLLIVGSRFSGSSMDTFLMLAGMLKIRVIITAYTQIEMNMYGDADPHIVRVINRTVENKEGESDLVSAVLAETAGLGVDGVLDLRESDDEASTAEIIQCLGMHARWVSCRKDLQLDPPESEQLFYRGASVCFLFVQSWLLAPIHHGRFMHIVKDFLDKVSEGSMRPRIVRIMPLEKIRQAHRLVKRMMSHEREELGSVVLRISE